MTRHIRQPGIGQIMIESMPTVTDTVDPGARNALSRALTPEYVGLVYEDFAGVTPAVMELASVENLRPSLIDTGHHKSGVVGYRSADSRSERKLFVAVTPAEYLLLSGNLHTFGERAVKLTENSRLSRRGYQADVDKAAAQRAGAHRLERPLSALESYAADLDKKSKLIDQFAKAADHPGFARFSDEAEMREELTYLRTFVFEEMLVAIGGVRGWNQAQSKLARKAVDARIFLDRDHNRNIGNFAAMLGLAKEWTGHKRAMTAERVYQAKRYMSQKALQEAGFASK